MTGEPPLDAFALVPEEMKLVQRWVTWRFRLRGGKHTKPPDQKVNDPSAWLIFTDAEDRRARGLCDGIGFVLGDGFIGIDLDGCTDDDGALHDKADDARDALRLGSYTERSPSGHGIHVILRATIAGSRKLGSREIYDGARGSSRYFTVTGSRISESSEIARGIEAQAHIDAFFAKWFAERVKLRDRSDAGAPALDDESVLRIMFGAKDGNKMRALHGGDTTSYASRSEADLGFVRKLRFYTRADAEQIDRIFRGSGLMRAKWDERRGDGTYGGLTTAKALQGGGPVYGHVVPAKRIEAEQKVATCALSTLSRLRGCGEVAVLAYLAIAAYANGEGEAWPSVATIAAAVNANSRNVSTAIQRLVRAKVITAHYRPSQTTLYRLSIGSNPMTVGTHYPDTSRWDSARTESEQYPAAIRQESAMPNEPHYAVAPQRDSAPRKDLALPPQFISTPDNPTRQEVYTGREGGVGLDRDRTITTHTDVVVPFAIDAKGRLEGDL